MKKLLSAILALSVVTSAMVFSACGKKESAGSAKSSVPSAPKVSRVVQPSDDSPIEVSVDNKKSKLTQVQLSELNQKITACQAIPTFTCTSDKLDAREISKDLTVSLISKNSSNSFLKYLEKNFERTADRMGFKAVDVAETDGTVSSLNDALAQAVTNKANMIVLAGDIRKDTIASYIENAQANGIEVVSAGTAGISHTDRFVDYTVPIPYESAGALMADWGIVKTSGKVHVLAVYGTESDLSQSVFRGFKEEFEKYVSSENGSCTTVSAASIELGNGLANKIKKAIESNNKINYIFVFDDGAVNDAISAIVQTGKDIKIVATGGTSEMMNLAQSGSIEMLVAHSYEWTAYAMIDYVLRLTGGLTLPAAQDVPFRILTKDVIKKAIEDYKDDFDGFHEICFGDEFVTGYNRLWNY